MEDNFYNRLDFYRMLHAGLTNLAEMSLALGVSIRTLQRWKKAFDPAKLGGQTFLSGTAGELKETGKNAYPPLTGNLHREAILEAMRRVALDGNVQAAKLLLTEYAESSGDDLSSADVLTVEKAVELLREWHGDHGK